MKVLKFGGTSVGTAASLLNVKNIIENLSEPAVIVVSALGGLTDKLIATARLAADGCSSYSDEMDAMVERHHLLISEVVPAAGRQKCLEEVNELLAELRRLYDGVSLIADLPDRTLDLIVSFGERMSSIIVTAMLGKASHHDSIEFVKTEKWFGKNIADTSLTTELIKKEFTPDTIYPAIAGGFISTDRDTGEITNLGRGGSDFTAALVAAALDADSLEIWTDVDGFMTSDPRIIPQARIIPDMSFVESMELCSFGAKVIYPPTIYPVFHKNIPIRILNTFNPDAPGTLITDHGSDPRKATNNVTGISALRQTCLICMRGPAARNVASITSRAFNALARKGVSVFLMSPLEENMTFTFALRLADKETALRQLTDEFAPEISTSAIEAVECVDNLAILAIVGDNILSSGGVSARVYNTFMRHGVEVAASSEGASRTTVTFVIKEEDTDQALRLVHSLFF